MHIFCIADEDTVRGFRLAGITGQPATSPADTLSALHQAYSHPDIGIIVITESLAKPIRNQMTTLQDQQCPPLIVEISGPEGPDPSRKGFDRLAQEAVGIRFEPREDT